MRYYISDCHFSHEKLTRFMDNRPFADGKEMDETMIRQWNSVVRRRDEVVILGDFSFADGERTNVILKRLNGRKFLVTGNHDKFLSDKKFDKSLLYWYGPYKEFRENHKVIVCSHYPILCYNAQYRGLEQEPDGDGSYEGRSYMMYGHVHNTYDEIIVNECINNIRKMKRTINRHGTDTEVNIPCQMINCFCMFSDYKPLTLEQWIEVDKKRRSELNKEANS